MKYTMASASLIHLTTLIKQQLIDSTCWQQATLFSDDLPKDPFLSAFHSSTRGRRSIRTTSNTDWKDNSRGSSEHRARRASRNSPWRASMRTQHEFRGPHHTTIRLHSHTPIRLLRRLVKIDRKASEFLVSKATICCGFTGVFGHT